MSRKNYPLDRFFTSLEIEKRVKLSGQFFTSLKIENEPCPLDTTHLLNYFV